MGTTLSGITVVSGVVASGGTIGNGNFEFVSAGGIALHTTIAGGGQQVVNGGGSAVDNVVANGGEQSVQGGGIVIGSTVSSGGDLILSGGGVASATVLRPGAELDLQDLDYSVNGGTATINPSTDVLSVAIGSATYTQQLSGSYPNAVLSLAYDGITNGTLVTVDQVACYAAGTRLATPAGERDVAALRAGDAVLAWQDGAWRAARVRWAGHVAVDLARHERPSQAAPVRIRAHAIAEGVPARDLLVSPDHAIWLDGALFQAQALCNGATIVQEFPARIVYHHVELDRHALLCAEGLAAESYLDTGNRALFAGEAGTRRLHADLAAGGSAAVWAAQACAPLHLDGPAVAVAHARLLRRAITCGHLLTADPALRLLADGRDVLSMQTGETWRANVPAGTRVVGVASRCFVPGWFAEPDRRRLGVAVAGVRLAGRNLARTAFAAGWHPAEDGWRWTDGAATLHLPATTRPATLTVRLTGRGARYWTAPRPAPAEREAADRARAC
jgi:antigen 43